MRNNNYFFCFLGCGFPKDFALKQNGQSLCLSTDNHLHIDGEGGKACQSNGYNFNVISNADDSSIPATRCALRFSSDNSYLTLKDDDKGEIRQFGKDGTTDKSKRYFLATDAGSGKVTIFNLGNQKYLKRERKGNGDSGHHAHVNGETGCGDDCHFILEDIRTAAPTATIGLLIKIYLEVTFI